MDNKKGEILKWVEFAENDMLKAIKDMEVIRKFISDKIKKD